MNDEWLDEDAVDDGRGRRRKDVAPLPVGKSRRQRNAKRRANSLPNRKPAKPDGIHRRRNRS